MWIRGAVVISCFMLAVYGLPQFGLSTLYQSNGQYCEAMVLDKCIPCGGQSYECSMDRYTSCTKFSDSSCTDYVGNVQLIDICSSEACSIVERPNYEFEVTTTNGLALYHFSRDDQDALVSLAPNYVRIQSFTLDRLPVGTKNSEKRLVFEQGIFSDNTYLTNGGFCTVGDQCTFDDFTYRLSPISRSSNDTIPLSTPSAGATPPFLFRVDTLGLLSATSNMTMILQDTTMMIPHEDLSVFELNVWPTGIVWHNFKVLPVGDDEDEVIFQVKAGSDFDAYLVRGCELNDGVCHIDPFLEVSGIMSNPFINPFFSFSFLFEDIGEDNRIDTPWDEQPAFNLFY